MSEWRVITGRCEDVLPTLTERIDAIVTDPPYGIGADAGVGKYGRLREYEQRWDVQPESLDHVMRPGVPVIIWGGNYFDLPPSRGFLVWHKGAGFSGRDFAECEFAWTNRDANARVFTYDPLAGRDYRGKEHPTQKPVAVMRWCLEQLGLAPGALVCDPYCGAGSTGVACRQMGLGFIGIEALEEFAAVARRRLASALNPQTWRDTENGDGPLFTGATA